MKRRQPPSHYMDMQKLYHMDTPQAIAAMSGNEAIHEVIRNVAGLAAEVKLSVLKTRSKPIAELLTQFDSLTSGTSLGSAKVMSTHLYSCQLGSYTNIGGCNAHCTGPHHVVPSR